MNKENCIFVDAPRECLSPCLGLDIIACLRNHRHLKLKITSRERLLLALEHEIVSPDRVKGVAGEAGRSRR